MPELTKQGQPRKRAVGAGRKPMLVRKVRLTVNILPTTRKALGKRPGAMLDRILNHQPIGGTSDSAICSATENER